MISNKYGYLVVLKFTEKKRYGGRLINFWLCQCEKCKRTEEIPQSQLQERRRACAVCSKGPCIICGSEIVRKTNGNTCSTACYQIKRKNSYNNHYAKVS